MMWEPREEYEARQRMIGKILWGIYTPSLPRPWDNVKIAWVNIGGQRKMLGVDNKTMQGYKMEENIPTFKKPLEKQDYDSFERWCTFMDL